ncbi:MAG: hypothetical protein A2808_02645 [Candidatus Moranbacteria bacterium RIFCSPHIGHO2_01_FULL_55_24]|nr:MAG: hypothetical protein A2808_02645 [Candidatus Moranbacteria bacterium RIFCSPHIGHO2_01_FULL_55_24]
MTINKTEAAVRSLKKARGTLETVLMMAEEKGSDCLATVQQIDSVIGLLRSARRTIVTNRMADCLGRELKGDKKVVDEMFRLYTKIS